MCIKPEKDKSIIYTLAIKVQYDYWDKIANCYFVYVHTLTQNYESLEKRNKVVDRKSEKSRSHSDMLDEKVPSYLSNS